MVFDLFTEVGIPESEHSNTNQDDYTNVTTRVVLVMLQVHVRNAEVFNMTNSPANGNTLINLQTYQVNRVVKKRQ